MPRQAIASRVYHELRQAPLLDAAGRVSPGTPTRSRRCTAGRRTPRRRRRCSRQAGVTTPFPIEIWWTPTHYGDASADEYAEIKRGLERGGVFKVTLKSAEWAQYCGALGKQYNAFQLGWFPDYPDAENYVVPFYQTGQLHLERLQQPEDDGADQGGAGGEDDQRRVSTSPADPGARRQGRPDHPCLAGQR